MEKTKQATKFDLITNINIYDEENIKNLFWCSKCDDMISYYSVKMSNCDTLNLYHCQKHYKNDKTSEIDKQSLFMIRNLEFECPFNNRGCHEILTFIGYDTHIEECKFQDINLDEICNSTMMNKWTCKNNKILSNCEWCEKSYCDGCLFDCENNIITNFSTKEIIGTKLYFKYKSRIMIVDEKLVDVNNPNFSSYYWYDDIVIDTDKYHMRICLQCKHNIAISSDNIKKLYKIFLNKFKIGNTYKLCDFDYIIQKMMDVRGKRLDHMLKANQNQCGEFDQNPSWQFYCTFNDSEEIMWVYNSDKQKYSVYHNKKWEDVDHMSITSIFNTDKTYNNSFICKLPSNSRFGDSSTKYKMTKYRLKKDPKCLVYLDIHTYDSISTDSMFK